MDISEKIKQIIANQLRINAEDITDNTDIIEDLGADSLDIVEVLMVVEEQFGVAIPDEEIPNIKSVCDLQTYIEANM